MAYSVPLPSELPSSELPPPELPPQAVAISKASSAEARIVVCLISLFIFLSVFNDAYSIQDFRLLCHAL
jgi:hypothetical protein